MCGYAGQLSDDLLSDFIREVFLREGIDLSAVDSRYSRLPIHSTILVDELAGTRTILFEKDDSDYGGEDWPPEEVLRSTRVLFLDHDFSERGERAARIAREAGIPVVADFERDEAPRFQELLGLADHLILNARFAGRITSRADPKQAAESLWAGNRSAVVVTLGDGGYWWMDSSTASEARWAAAFAVEAVDTTGCGDVFHGAYAACLARGETIEGALRMAAGAAALKARVRGGQAGAPSRAEVEAFVRSVDGPR